MKKLVSKAIAVGVSAPTHRVAPRSHSLAVYSLANFIPFMKCPLIVSG